MSGAISGHMDLGGMNIFVFILVGLVTFNFFIELGLNLVIAPAIHRVILLVEHRVSGGRKKTEVPQTEASGDDHLH